MTVIATMMRMRVTLPGTDSGGTNKESQAITTNTGDDICAKSEQIVIPESCRQEGIYGDENLNYELDINLLMEYRFALYGR